MSDGMTASIDETMSLADDYRKEAAAKTKAAIFEDIKANPLTWKEDISKRLKCHRQTVTSYVKELVAEGRVESIRRGNMDQLRAREG